MRYRISLDMTIGLHHLYQRGILHRDLKSLNVLLDMNFRAKLADFGLSTLRLSSVSTTSGGQKGTPRWMSPELFKRGAKTTTASRSLCAGDDFLGIDHPPNSFADAPNQEVALDWIKSGEQENIPEGTPEEFKAMILEGWHIIRVLSLLRKSCRESGRPSIFPVGVSGLLRCTMGSYVVMALRSGGV